MADLHELLVPVLDVCSFLARVGVVILGRRRIVLVVGASLEDFAEDGFENLAEDGFGDLVEDGFGDLRVSVRI